MRNKKALFLYPYMRGERKLKKIVTSQYPQQATLFVEESLYAEKVKTIVARYHYYQQFIGVKRYEDLLTKLKNEFHLQPRRIVEIIDENICVLETVKTEATSKKWFEDKWPHFNWR